MTEAPDLLVFMAGVICTVPFMTVIGYVFYNKGFTKGVELAEDNMKKNGWRMQWPWLKDVKPEATGDEAAKELVKALQEGKRVVIHEQIGMAIVNAAGVERTCMEVPKPGADNAEQ